MTTRIGSNRTESAPPDIDALWAGLSRELANGNSVTFTITPAAVPTNPQLALLPDPEPQTEEEDNETWVMPRTNQDELWFLPRTGKGILYRSAARLCLRWERGYLKQIAQVEPSEQDLRSFLESRPDFHDSCDFADRYTDRDLITRTVIAVAHYGFSRTNGRETAEGFLVPFATGAGLELQSPALTLRNKLKKFASRNKKQTVPNDVLLVMLVRAYVLHLKGASVTKLRWPNDFKTPSIPRLA